MFVHVDDSTPNIEPNETVVAKLFATMAKPRYGARDLSFQTMNTLEQRLRDALRDKGLDPDARETCGMLAKVAGVSYQAASKWLAGKTATMKPEPAKLLADWLGTDPLYIQTGKKTESAPTTGAFYGVVSSPDLAKELDRLKRSGYTDDDILRFVRNGLAFAKVRDGSKI